MNIDTTTAELNRLKVFRTEVVAFLRAAGLPSGFPLPDDDVAVVMFKLQMLVKQRDMALNRMTRVARACFEMDPTDA